MARDVAKKESLQEVGECWDCIETKDMLNKDKVNHLVYGYVNSLMHHFHSNGSQC